MTPLQLPIYKPIAAKADWLIGPANYQAKLYCTARKEEIVLSNGLISRTFRISQGSCSTVALDNLMTGESMLRAVRPEATLKRDGKEIPVGGLEGQPDLAYLKPEWLDSMKPSPGSLAFEGYDVGKTIERMPWKRVRHAPDVPWPPKGVALSLHFSGHGLRVDVHYEMYDGIPVIAKWLTIANATGKPVKIDSFTSEVLSLVEAESIVDSTSEWRKPNVTIATDYSFGGMAMSASNRTVYWEPEPDYKTQVNYELKMPCKLEIRPPVGPRTTLETPSRSGRVGEQSESGWGLNTRHPILNTFTAFELFHDSTDRERQGLAIRRMFRALAPWTQENPIMLHLTSVDPKTVHTAIDQAAECGFEMIVISFWSGLDMEDISEANIAKFKEFREYANKKGVELGGYSLLASRSIDKENDVVNPKPIFGASPCLGSKWGIAYFEKLRTFIEKTGFNLLEHDGSYPGDTCASTSHPGHVGYEDSQWMQYHEIADFYRWCRARGMYLNVPDNYFLAGSNKTGMGYRESNWSLPREQQHIHARQNLYDGTWEKTPSMGWMMVPLVEYQGGGPAATIEPLRDHIADYEMHLANNFGYGAQACYRGPRLYDSPETKAAVVKWVRWFKKYREILESDVIHIRRADGRGLDAVLHVNPLDPSGPTGRGGTIGCERMDGGVQTLDARRTTNYDRATIDNRKSTVRAMAVVYNPTDRPLTQDLVLPLYYAGLAGSCQVAEKDGKSRTVKLDPQSRLTLRVTVPARLSTWFVIR